MRFKGSLKEVNKDWANGKFIISFYMDEGNIAEVNDIRDKELIIQTSKFSNRRSIDANAYCWVLCTKIAEVLNTSKDEVYEEMIQKYGILEKDERGYFTITIRNDVDISILGGHWKFYKTDGHFNAYLKIKGSSEYTTREMSYFIDMIVRDAKELGIETMTPTELEELKRLWQRN